MARAHDYYASPALDAMHPHHRPDPVRVARIFDGYSADAACERWSSLSPGAVNQLAKEGRRIIAAREAAA